MRTTLLCVAAFMLGVSLGSYHRGRAKVDAHIDAEQNIICYTHASEMECFPYNDEGTHLEPAAPAR